MRPPSPTWCGWPPAPTSTAGTTRSPARARVASTSPCARPCWSEAASDPRPRPGCGHPHRPGAGGRPPRLRPLAPPDPLLGHRSHPPHHAPGRAGRRPPVTLAPALDAVTLTDLARVAARPDFDRWHHQITRTGGCAAPIRLRGWTKTTD